MVVNLLSQNTLNIVAALAAILHYASCFFARRDAEPSDQGARSQYAAKRKGILRGLHLHADDAEIAQVRPEARLSSALAAAAAMCKQQASSDRWALTREAMSLQYMANLVERQQTESYLRRAWPAGSGRLTGKCAANIFGKLEKLW